MIIMKQKTLEHGLVVQFRSSLKEVDPLISHGNPKNESLVLDQLDQLKHLSFEMLMGHTDGLAERQSSEDQLRSDPELAATEDDDENGAADNSEEILYAASFEELASNTIKYETIIWVSISLLLVLAWGVGIFMLLYVPIRRYVLREDILSRKLYITSSEVVYKVSRPSFIQFWGKTTIEKRVPLSLVIDVIIEQGCLQSVYGIHTFRVESVAHGKAAPVDELQVQGVANPGLLRKVIVTEAAKVIQDAGRNWKLSALTGEGESMPRMASLTEGAAVFRSPSKSWKLKEMAGSSHQAMVDRRGIVPGELILQKIDEVHKSVEKLKLLVEKSKDSPRRRLEF